jgi:hypothetical protein
MCICRSAGQLAARRLPWGDLLGDILNDVRSWPASQRVSHYRELAARLRQMAEMETVGPMRDQLLALAEQYQQLASKLIDRWPRAER